jgi:hypothetical protein
MEDRGAMSKLSLLALPDFALFLSFEKRFLLLALEWTDRQPLDSDVMEFGGRTAP